MHFNPRSPRGERHWSYAVWRTSTQFQSTLPAGGATMTIHQNDKDARISIHAPRGGSDQKATTEFDAKAISIHAPRGGSVLLLVQIIPHRITDFNPRSPRGERQIACKCKRKGIQISIHAPRGGSDLRGVHSALQTTDFNPRSPRGERL